MQPTSSSQNLSKVGPDTSLADFVASRYLPFIRENKRSRKANLGNLKRHILPHHSSYRLSAITSDVLNKWADTLTLVGLSYSSRFRLFWLTKYVLNCAKPVLLDTSEVLRILKLLKNYRHRASANAIHLILLTNANKAEILNARWQDVDFKQGTLTTDKTFTGRSRLIHLNNEALKLIHGLPRRDDVPCCSSRATALASRPSPTSGSRCARDSAARNCVSRTCATPSRISSSASASTRAICELF